MHCFGEVVEYLNWVHEAMGMRMGESNYLAAMLFVAESVKSNEYMSPLA